MKKESLIIQLVVIAILLVGMPAGMFYYFDSQRITQLNNLQKKILSSENKAEIDILKKQIEEKINKLGGQVESLSEKGVNVRYASITENRIIKNSSYVKPGDLSRIKDQFMRAGSTTGADLILLYRDGAKNGNPIAANKPDLMKMSFKGNEKYLHTVSSQKTSSEVNFSDGSAEFFISINDAKQRQVSVLYIKENISGIAKSLRTDNQWKSGYNFIVDSAGRMLLNTKMEKEGSENVLSYPDIKAILDEQENNINVKEASYDNFRGFLGYKKIPGMDYFLCVFVPNTALPFMNKKLANYETNLNNTEFILPVYGILALTLILGIMWMVSLSGMPFKPLARIVKVLARIDEESFQELLPKIKSGDYKKLIDSLLILRGRITAAEEKTQKLSQMSKELEDELSKEASRADAEISELRDAVKIAENNKAALEDRLSKMKDEGDREKRDQQSKLSGEKSMLEQKVSTLQKENDQLKQDAKKGQASGIPVEKENMRMDSVLMMNTELKGVLSVIKTYISSVLGGEGKITDAQQQFLGVVINKSARLERLINDLTELAKLEKGDIKLARQPVEINNIIQDIIFAIQPQADIKKVEMKVNFAPTLPTAYGDPGRLSNVVSQIMNQAIKVSPRGGQVIIETKDGGRDVLIRISDFGMSMPQSKSAVLFVNFHGPESMAGPEFVNTGLRFPILKAIINNMGGEIWIESEIGKGKTFVVSLPKGQGEAAAKPVLREEDQPKHMASMKIAPGAAGNPPAAQPAGFRIQRNTPGDFGRPEGPKKEEPVPTVTDLLNLDVPIMDALPNLPGKDVKVPPDLLKKDEKPKKEEPVAQLPDELPPLPELEDDKGSDIIK
jgi:signal transduction histidine kinase